MPETIHNLKQQELPGELQRLRLALLTDQSDLLTATRQRLVRLARARGIEPHLLDDVVQETLLEAWGHLERLQAPAGFHAWIDEICRNVCRRAVVRRRTDLLRNEPLQPGDGESGEGEGTSTRDFPDTTIDDPLEELDRRDLMVLLDHALGALPPASRQIIEMCHVLELPHFEVAERLGISSGTLDVRLHRTRRQLRQILHGPLRKEAEALGLTLDAELIEGWQETRLWCPLCARHHLHGYFLSHENSSAGPNLHLRCPSCAQLHGLDTVHSMGLVSLDSLHSFRPAWKRTMQGLADRLMPALLHGQLDCLFCGKKAFVQVQSNDTENSKASGETGPYPFWISLHCVHCGNAMDGQGCLPSFDQLVYWSHPRSRQFLQQHPRLSSQTSSIAEYQGQQALQLQMDDLESSEQLTVLVHRQTLQILEIF
ncbi:MAG TPA: RNA polymerase sigma factor [Ktedonobacteraceae bacterium]|nr:RNA polymerase sigma factor [Ktedonobacteraceae bacterium]